MKIKKILTQGPEIYLIGATIYYWYLTAWPLNPVAILLLSFLIYQVIKKKNAPGLIISAYFILLCLYMGLALIVESNKFQQKGEAWEDMGILGVSYFGTVFIAAYIMFYKYLMKRAKPIKIAGKQLNIEH